MPNRAAPSIRFSQDITPAFTAASVALAIGAVATAAAFYIEYSAWRWVVHTREVLERLESTRSSLAEAQTARRGLLLNRSDAELRRFASSATRVHAEISEIRRLTADNPRQQAAIDPLEAEAAELLRELREAAVAPEKIGDGSDLEVQQARFDAVRDRLAGMRREEERLLAERTGDADRARIVTIAAVVGLSVLALLLMAFVRRVVVRDTAALDQSEKRLRLLADNMSQLAWIAAPNGEVLWYNKRWYDYAGTTPKDMQRIGWRSLQHPEYAERVVSKVQHCLESGEPWEDTFPLRSRDGTYRWFLSRAVPIRDAAGRIDRWFGTSTDITPQREAEAALADLNRSLEARVQARTLALEEANAEMEAFTYSVSHDLRAPLRGIHGYAQAIEEDFGSALPDEARGYLARIASAAGRMEDLIQDLLTYSRVTRGDLPISAIDLDSAIDAVQQALKAAIAESNAVVVVDKPLGRAMATRAVLLQMLQNLLSNAVKFVPKGERPHVHIFSERRAEKVRVWVEDNGIGIEPRHQERIFRVFERLHGADIYPGTGIGLAIVRKAAERLGGAVGVESTPARGSRFWFELPAAPEPA